MKYYLLTLLITLYLLNINKASAETIRWSTESWESYTNKDNSGLYHDIVRAAFDGHQLEVTYMPWKRSLLNVKNGTADMTGATSFVDDYIASRYAVLATPVSILFDKRKITYTDLQSLRKYVAVWPSPYEDELILSSNKAFIRGFSVQERETAYKLLVSGRADYFLDTKGLHQAWLETIDKELIATPQTPNYQLVDISRLDLFMIFSDNARGQRLKDIFDKGMAKLIQRGQLLEIYKKYNFLEQMPAGFR
jgi:polar amino acid transport system substrate-binding protein